MKRLTLILLLIITGILSQPARAIRVYFIGNSLISELPFDNMSQLFISDGVPLRYGFQSRGGGSLDQHWNEPEESGIQSNIMAGRWPEALRDMEWDALVLTPIFNLSDWPANNRLGDITASDNFIKYAKTASPDMQVFIYATYVMKEKIWGTNPVQYQPYNYQELWDRPYVEVQQNGILTKQCREFFEILRDTLNVLNPDLAKPVKLLNVGEVIYEVDKAIKAGEIPGLDQARGAEQFMADQYHYNLMPHTSSNPGNWTMACTFYAALSGKDPRDLNPVYHRLDAAWHTAAASLADVVYDVLKDDITVVSKVRPPAGSALTLPATDGVLRDAMGRMVRPGRTASGVYLQYDTANDKLHKVLLVQ